jgi:hypothetical protein
MITSTKDRINKAKEIGLDYEVLSEPTFMPELNGWLVRTCVIVHADGEDRKYTSSTFRAIESNSVYTSLETADTASTGRCFGKMGIGIDEEFATSDEIAATRPNTPVLPTQNVRAVYPAHIKQEITTPDGKVISIDTEKNYHDTAVAVTLAAKEGDAETVNEIIESIPEVSEIKLSIPPKEEAVVNGQKVMKRNLKLKGVKDLWEEFVKAGASTEALEDFKNITGRAFKDHNDLMRYGDDEVIEEYYEYLQSIKISNNEN